MEIKVTKLKTSKDQWLVDGLLDIKATTQEAISWF